MHNDNDNNDDNDNDKTKSKIINSSAKSSSACVNNFKTVIVLTLVDYV